MEPCTAHRVQYGKGQISGRAQAHTGAERSCPGNGWEQGIPRRPEPLGFRQRPSVPVSGTVLKGSARPEGGLEERWATGVQNGKTVAGWRRISPRGKGNVRSSAMEEFMKPASFLEEVPCLFQAWDPPTGFRSRGHRDTAECLGVDPSR